MALDAATLELTARELKTVLADAKIAKLFEPTRDELVITLRTRTDTYALLLSARSGSARVCLTEESFENPETPPSFCMLMRKHLTGGKLLDVHMEPGDRIVYFDFQCTNEMGDLVQNILCAELMGRYSNLVLVQNGKIIDALKRVDFEDSDIRQLLPGRAVQRQSQQHHRKGENTHDAAAKHPHHAGDQLGKDELAFRHRQGVHQVTLAPQQVAGEPLDDGECGDDCDGDTQHQVNDRDNCDGKIRSQRRKAEKRPQQCSSSQNGQIQSAVNAAGGLELIL